MCFEHPQSTLSVLDRVVILTKCAREGLLPVEAIVRGAGGVSREERRGREGKRTGVITVMDIKVSFF